MSTSRQKNISELKNSNDKHLSSVSSHPLLPTIDDDFDSNDKTKDNGLNKSNSSNDFSISFKTCDEDLQINNEKPTIPPRKVKNTTKSFDDAKIETQVSLANESRKSEQSTDSQLSEFFSRLQPNYVRWFYKEEAAPKWSVFNGMESLKIEMEYLACLPSNLKECKNIQVLNNLYEVNIAEKKCVPIYWESPSYFVMRGVWFYDQSWEPLDEELSDRIELEHINKFKEVLLNQSSPKIIRVSSDEEMATFNNPSNLNKDVLNFNFNETQQQNDTNKNKVAKSQAEPIYSIAIKDLTCHWYSHDEVYLSKSKTFMKTLALSFGKQKYGQKIVRGYRALCDTDDKVEDVNHLVFVIHGIAQKLYEKSIIKNCDDLRKNFELMKTKFFPNSNEIRSVFIPVDWRSSLTLDAGIIESITPETLKFIRDKLNSSALDIMYYTSPLFRYEIINGLCTELNRLYKLFCEKNPYFVSKNCKVSVVAHSLGSVIFYDILTMNDSYFQFTNSYGENLNQETKVMTHFAHNDTNLLNEYLEAKKKIHRIEEKLIKINQSITRLEFNPENLFCLGSPLAVFLALRGVRPSGNGLQDHILPKTLCKHLFNIFHPCDAIAYRLEPLILKHYSTIQPVDIHRSGDNVNVKHLAYKEIKNKPVKTCVELASTKDPTSISFNFLKGKKSNESNPPSTDSQDMNETLNINSMNLVNAQRSSVDSIDQVDLENRIDYQLPFASYELISALTAHTSYWTSTDVALFIVTQLKTDE